MSLNSKLFIRNVISQIIDILVLYLLILTYSHVIILFLALVMPESENLLLIIEIGEAIIYLTYIFRDSRIRKNTYQSLGKKICGISIDSYKFNIVQRTLFRFIVFLPLLLTLSKDFWFKPKLVTLVDIAFVLLIVYKIIDNVNRCYNIKFLDRFKTERVQFDKRLFAKL